MSNKTRLTAKINVDVEIRETVSVSEKITLTIDEIVEFCDNLDYKESQLVLAALGTTGTVSHHLPIESLADEMKYDFIKSIFNKYTLTELENKLK